MDLQLDNIADLLSAVDRATADSPGVGSPCATRGPEQLAAYETALLLMTDTQGNVLACDDFGHGIGPDVVAPLALELAVELAENTTCRLKVPTGVGERLALAVRVPDGHQQKILACLVRPGAVSQPGVDAMSTELFVCGAFAWSAAHGHADQAKLLRRIEHLLAEQEMRKASHAEAIDAIVCEREQRRLKEQENAHLEELINAAEAATRAKSEFLANASHELRTPLTAILGFADLLYSDVSDEQREEYVQTIRRNGRMLLEMVNDVLDLSKLEAGKMTIELLACSPFEIVQELISLMEIRAEQSDLRLMIDYRFPIPETIQADPVRLRQILLNLIGNAIKFTEDGEVRITLAFARPSDSAPRMLFEVSDTGVGIDPEAVERLFDPFSQADASTTRRFGGTGLGLAISERLATMLGGRIDVTSTLGEGSTFALSLDPGPLEDVPMLTQPPASAYREGEPESELNARRERLHGRVLLAEDGPDNQRLISFILKKSGLQVDLAENGKIAVEYAQRSIAEGEPYDLILMDMQMPEMDGYEATRHLRQSGWEGPVIALTAHAMTGDRTKCLEAGCDDYLTKPIDHKAFFRVVGHYLRDAVAAVVTSGKPDC